MPNIVTYIFVSEYITKTTLEVGDQGQGLTSIRMAAFLYDGLRLEAKPCNRQNHLYLMGSSDSKCCIFFRLLWDYLNSIIIDTCRGL